VDYCNSGAVDMEYVNQNWPCPMSEGRTYMDKLKVVSMLEMSFKHIKDRHVVGKRCPEPTGHI